MGREIKFRAWYKPLGVMIEPEKLEMINFEVKVLGVYLEMDGKGFNKLRISDFELLQYTGLKDKNGREIYEGDIVESEEIGYSDSGHFSGMKKVLGTVVYTNGRFAIHKTTGALPDLIMGLNYHKVIGSVHENPELLEV